MRFSTNIWTTSSTVKYSIGWQLSAQKQQKQFVTQYHAGRHVHQMVQRRLPSLPDNIQNSVDGERSVTVDGASATTLELTRNEQVPCENIMSEDRLIQANNTTSRKRGKPCATLAPITAVAGFMPCFPRKRAGSSFIANTTSGSWRTHSSDRS